MTLVKIDLGDVAGGHHPDDYVTIRAEAFREAVGGGVTSTAEVKIPLVDGVGQAEVEPGPVVVAFRCQAVADTREKRGVVPSSGTVGIEDVIAGAFEYTPPVVNRALETIEGAVAAEVDAIKWVRGTVLAHSDLNNFTTPGVYEIPTWSTANTLINKPPQAAIQAATLTVTKTATAIHQQWQKISELGQDQVEMVRHRTGGVWSEWREPWGIPQLRELVNTASWRKRQITSGEDVNNLTTSGIYWAPIFSITNTLVNRPPGTPGIPTGFFEVTTVGEAVHQRWQKVSAIGQAQSVMERRRVGGEWSEWQGVGAGGSGEIYPNSQMPESNARAEMLRQMSRIRRGGVIGTGGRTPVSLSFDHGCENFRELVLPELIRLGLPCSLAVNPDTFHTGGEHVTWADLEGWSINHGVEISHHARSHADVPGALDDLPALEHQILSSIEEARIGMPEVVADSFVMPGVSGTKWDGFNAIDNYDLWWEHPAGRMILGNFPVVTWGMYGAAVPMAGAPVQGVDRIGLDTGAQINAAKAQIAAIEGTGLGISVFMHPIYLTTAGRPDIVALTDFLEWLAAERDAGRVEVLTISGFAYADARQNYGVDLTALSGWSGSTATIAIGPMLNYLAGAQVALMGEATTSGSVTVRAVSDAGGLNTSRTITVIPGQPICMPFSIPKTATTITMTCPASVTARRVMPV